MAVDHEKDLILITSASGKQASHLIPLLYNKWERLRLVVHSQSSEERLKKQWPNAEVLRVDLGDRNDCRRIMTGVTTVLHIGPSFHPYETEVGYSMIDAAVAESQAPGSSFKHFVLSSVLCTQLRKLLNHDCKRYIEEYLFESGLEGFTILQPTHFMDMFPLATLLDPEDKEPVWTANWDPEVKFSFIALRDLAEAMATVIEGRDVHFGAQYPLVSTRPHSYTEVVRVVGEVIGKKIRIERREPAEASTALMTMLFGDADKVPASVKDAAERLLLYYNRRGLIGNPGVLEWLIRREATTRRKWTELKLQEVERS